jgi:hypothetical protein
MPANAEHTAMDRGSRWNQLERNEFYEPTMHDGDLYGDTHIPEVPRSAAVGTIPQSYSEPGGPWTVGVGAVDAAASPDVRCDAPRCRRARYADRSA